MDLGEHELQHTVGDHGHDGDADPEAGVVQVEADEEVHVIFKQEHRRSRALFTQPLAVVRRADVEGEQQRDEEKHRRRVSEKQYRIFRRGPSRLEQRMWAGVTNVIAGICLVAMGAILVVYILAPDAPSFAIQEATLEVFRSSDGYDTTTVTKLQITLKINVNNYDRSSVNFTDIHLRLRLPLANRTMAEVYIPQINVPALHTFQIPTVATASNHELNEPASTYLNEALTRNGTLQFELQGEATTHRTVAGLIKVNEHTRLNCKITFNVEHGTSQHFTCQSASKYLYWDDTDDE